MMQQNIHCFFYIFLLLVFYFKKQLGMQEALKHMQYLAYTMLMQGKEPAL
jgi:hypothetical protein